MFLVFHGDSVLGVTGSRDSHRRHRRGHSQTHYKRRDLSLTNRPTKRQAEHSRNLLRGGPYRNGSLNSVRQMLHWFTQRPEQLLRLQVCGQFGGEVDY